MKAFALVLLCVVAAAQGRSTGAENARWTEAVSGQNPWLVHLRLAVATSGFLDSCVGSLIDQRWLLTSAGCVFDARFIWSRYNAIDTVQPELVLETSTVTVNVIIHPEYDAATGANDIALISLNRDVWTSDTIAPVAIAAVDAEVPSSGSLCGYGATEDNNAGDRQRCFAVDLATAEDGSIVATSEEGEATKFDLGAPLVIDGVQYGVLTVPGGDNAAVFINPANYRDWIEETTGVTLA